MTKAQRKRFKSYEIGYVHVDNCELRHADDKLIMFLAIDRVSKFTYVEFHDSAGKMEGSAFLRNVVELFPCHIHTILTDDHAAIPRGTISEADRGITAHPSSTSRPGTAVCHHRSERASCQTVAIGAMNSPQQHYNRILCLRCAFCAAAW